jgi:fructuronate reductase
MRRLSPQHLANLPASVRRPSYDLARINIGMAHIGVGAFHRCHQAEFTDDILEQGFHDWGIVGVNLRPPRLTNILSPQGGLFSRTLLQCDQAETRVIGALRATIDVEDAPSAEAAVHSLASPAISVVTMTVTEKGYCHVPATSALDLDNPGIRADLASTGPPETALGLLALALERRRAESAPGLTLISCDNIPSNSELLRSVLLTFANARSPALAQWIDAHVAFPCTMVDRIVPATTPEDIDTIARRLGMIDEAAVVGEPYRQWVIEDRFAGARPPWDLAGAQFVSKARPYELIKMRLLNAAQSTLSHLGALVGHEFSFEAVADPVLAAVTRRMLERETITTLPPVEGMEVGPYIDACFARIANSAIRHRCHQIGTDGSQKIVQRIVSPLRERLEAGQGVEWLTLSLAGWIAYVFSGAARFDRRWTPSDPWAAKLTAIVDSAGADFAKLAKAALGIEAIFGADFDKAPIVKALAADLSGLLSRNPRAFLSERLADA